MLQTNERTNEQTNKETTKQANPPRPRPPPPQAVGFVDDLKEIPEARRVESANMQGEVNKLGGTLRRLKAELAVGEGGVGGGRVKQTL